jgi:LDH2 family malate/lactate/ureidoglycolate dehydrogenase
MPGEIGDRRSKAAEESGEIEIADGVWNELCKFVDAE